MVANKSVELGERAETGGGLVVVLSAAMRTVLSTCTGSTPAASIFYGSEFNDFV